MTSETPDDPTSVDLSVDLDEVLRPRGSLRRRAVQAGSVVALLLVVVWTLLRGVAPSGVAPSPPPTVVIAANVSFGVVTLNGNKLAGSLPILITTAFRSGANVVTLSAPPFQPHTCTVRVSGNVPVIGQTDSQSGCGIAPGSTYRVNGAAATPTFTVVFSLDSTDLPSEQSAQAYATAIQAIAAVPLHTVIPSGQYYAAGLDPQGHLIARQAATPLQATVLVGVPDPQVHPGWCSMHVACAGPAAIVIGQLAAQPGLAGQRIWAVDVGVTLSWRYTSPTGTVTRSPQMPLSTSIQLFLKADQPTGTWSVLVLPAALVAGTSGNSATGPDLPSLSDQLRYGLCDIGTQLVAPQGVFSVEAGVLQNQGVAGCENQALPGGSSSNELGTFLWRFGVLLAVDKIAQSLAPWLPHAPPAEVAAVSG